MTSPLLEVEDLTKHFNVRQGLVLAKTIGVVRAVDGISFAVGRGETLALVGEFRLRQVNHGALRAAVDRSQQRHDPLRRCGHHRNAR